MKTPNFWRNKGFISGLLLPFGWIYGAATAWRMASGKPYKAPCPVICIGNITAGGTGKTPVSIAVAQMLQNLGKNPFFISRGYGGTLKGIQVLPEKHSPQQVGDEPLLLAQTAPTIVNPDRASAAKLAIKLGADCLIMDDGFQNPGLFKDISLLVFDGTYGIGNGRVIPSGPLRETLAQGEKRAQGIVILGNDAQNLTRQTSLPVFYGYIEEEKTQKVRNKKVLAFAGIGHPEKFYHSLEKCGFKIGKSIDFPDHHFYTTEDLQKIIEIAKQNHLEIYTTSKDFVKIPMAFRKDINVLRIKAAWKAPQKMEQLLKKAFD